EGAPCHPLRRGELDGAGEIFAVRAEIQEIRRVIEVHAECPVGPRVSEFAVDFVEAGHRFGHVAVWKKTKTVRIEAGRSWLRHQGAGAITIAAGVIVLPSANIEYDRAERRADAAVKVDFRGRVVGKLDALSGNARVELPVRIDVVARLKIGRDRRL